MTDTPVRTDVPLDFHPCSTGHYETNLAIPGTIGPKALASIKEALHVAYTVHGSINDADRDLRALASPDAPTFVHNNKLVKEHGLEDQLALAASKATDRAVQTIDRRVNDLEAQSASLRETINTAIDYSGRNTPAGIAESTEIRAYVRSLPEIERMTFVRNAITSGDIRTAAAVLHTPAYLSGLNQEVHDHLRTAAANHFAPVESQLLDGMQKAVAHLVKGSRNLQSRNAEVTAVAAGRAMKRKEALERLK